MSLRYYSARSSADLEDHLERELHLPAALFALVAPEVVGVVDVTVRERAVHAVQHVEGREAELHVEGFADHRHGEVLKERRIPEELLLPAEDVPPQRADVRPARIA